MSKNQREKIEKKSTFSSTNFFVLIFWGSCFYFVFKKRFLNEEVDENERKAVQK